MKNGDVKRGAGNTVRLLRDNTALDTLLARACSVYHAEDERLRNKSDVVDYATKVVPRLNRDTHVLFDSLLGSLAIAASPTGMSAHYRFERVRPGRYVLWARTEIDEHLYVWWAPIAVRTPTESLTRDLDNSVVTEQQSDNEWIAVFYGLSPWCTPRHPPTG